MLLLMATEGQVSALQVETWEQFQNKLHNLICCGSEAGPSWNHCHPLGEGRVVALLCRVLGPRSPMLADGKCIFQCRKAPF